MEDDIAIKVENVSKKFSRSLKRSMLYGVKDIGRNALGFGSNPEKLRKGEFWAVDDVSFELRKGETLGLIGPNGSGKSTILKMLNGIYWPDKGKITINGKVGALIEVGAGFHPMLTGRENIYINAAILGMTKEETDDKFDDIVKFADIGDFLDSPVKFYSSGMYVRLGFAVAVYCEPDILLVDEVLAVGDVGFRAKCNKKMSELKNKKTSIVLVSHSIPLVQNICDSCVVLDRGKEHYQGNIIDSVSKYYEIVSATKLKDREKTTPHFIDKELDVRSIRIMRNGSEENNTILSGDSVEFIIEVNAKKAILKPQITLTLNGDTYSGFSTQYDSFNIEKIHGETIISLKIRHLGLGVGIYDVSLGIWDSDMLNSYYWRWDAARIVVKSSKSYLGRFEFEHEWSYRSDI